MKISKYILSYKGEKAELNLILIERQTLSPIIGLKNTLKRVI